MKKTLLLLVSAVVLLAGCAKEKFADLKGGELTSVTFNAQMENGVATRAVADGDGAAANVNRCIMEVYYGGELFTRMYAKVIEKTASFTTQLVSNRTYTVAFWADNVDNVEGEDIATDKYYTTAQGLGAVALKGTYAGNLDARDAFAFCGDYTIAQGGSAFPAKLKRPFAQINVITTDVETVKKVASLKPEKVNVTVKNAVTKYNVLDSTAVAGETADLNYEATLYNWNDTKSECTLSMDYIFAEKEKAVVDIDWKASKDNNADVAHSFASVPYQRNYRTNIKGALLTTTGKWNVTVDPNWESSESGKQEIVYEVVNDIKDANTIIANEIASGKKEISVKFISQPNDAGTPGSTSEGVTSKAIVTTNLPADGALNILVEAQTKELYIGDYTSETNITVVTSGTNAAAVNVNIPTGSSIQKLVINAPSKTVYLNGVQVASAGVITELDVITSNNTLIIEKGQSVGTLIMRQGGLEIHGTIGAAVVEVAQGENVYVRDCENLSQDVYDVLAPYIADGYVSVKGKTTPNLWDIVPATAYEAAIGKVGYETLAAAMAAVQENDIVTLLKNIEMTSTLDLNVNANYSLNLNGKTISSTVDAFNILAGKLTLIGNGTVDTQGTDSKYSFRVANSGKFVIGAENQNYDIVINDLVKSTTETTIWGGTISKVCCFARYGGPKSDVTINGGKIKYLDNVGFSSEDCPTTFYLNGGIYGGFEPVSETAKVYCKYVPKEGYEIGDNPDEATKTDYPYALVKAPEYYPGTTIPVVTIDGVVWAPVNCGYDATHKAGLLYQWGRKYGQDFVDANVTFEVSTQSTTWAMGNNAENKNKFYKQNLSWYYLPDGTTLWPADYDPCPDGWRVPSESEFLGLIAHVSSKMTVGDYEGYYFSGSKEYSETISRVFFPMPQYRGQNGSLTAGGMYWSNTPDPTISSPGGYGNGTWCAKGKQLSKWTDPTTTMSLNKGRAVGGSVRCVKKTE